MRDLMLRSGQEALDTGKFLGHPVLPIFGLKMEDILQSNRLVETLLDTLLAGFTLPNTLTTVLQDWMKGRRSEADNLNGHVVMEARRLGLASPVNAAIIELSHRIEQGSLKQEPANFHLLQDLVGQLSKSAPKEATIVETEI